jgi:hypothetical protein
MRKVLSILSLLIALFFLAQCSKDKAPAPSTCNVPALGYANNVKAILDANCATSGCHDAITLQSGFDYSSYSSAKAGVGISICKMKGTCGSIMPPSGKMADSLICIIEGWENQGYPN